MQHAKSIAHITEEFHTNTDTGHTTKRAAELLAEHGPNSLPKDTATSSIVSIFIDQWKSPLILILVVAGTVSGLLGERIDMAIIYITACLNACIGFFQEFKANSALGKLRSLVSYSSIVLRDGKKIQIPSEHIVIGDVVLLEAGDSVPADGRLFVAESLEVNEAVLTGESVPAQKNTAVIDGDVALGERKNMVFKGTTVSDGKGTFVVTGIGAGTELGKIATLVEDTQDDQTPLQQQLAALAKKLSWIVLAIAVGIFFIGLFFGGGRYHTLELFETSVAVAVAAVPEGLVISLTVILAIGMQFILKRNALVRKLVAAETLGSVSVICTDKTGTLTEGNMSVVSIHTADGAHKAHDFSALKKQQNASLAIQIGLICNNAIEHKKDDRVHLIGDTTETALVEAGSTAGFSYSGIQKEFVRISEVPFSSTYKYMATLDHGESGRRMHVKGAPEVLLERASQYIDAGKIKKMSHKQQEIFQDIANTLAATGYRTLALGYKKMKVSQSKIVKDDVANIVFVGIVAIADPVREDVKETLAIAKQAGIRVIMITGDHASTAHAIGKELGLIDRDGYVCEGEEIDTYSDQDLLDTLEHTNVFARVAPSHKIRIVQALQKQGEIVSMTGDGVNDAPAIKGADIGVAVGSGTDVAKQTADIVLLDDSFTTIVAAVEEGRGIYQNIKKVVLYLLSGGFAEVLMITGSIVAGFPIAALPAQILWVNIVENTFPTMALAFDKGDRENMKEPPRKKTEPLIDTEMKTMIVIKTIVANILLFGIFVYFYTTTKDIVLTRTIVFVGFGIDALFYVFSIRSLRHMVWQMSLFKNMYLIGAVVFGWVMLILAIYWSPLQTVLRTVPLNSFHWAVMVCFGVTNLALIEIIKGIFIVKMQHKKNIFQL